MKLRYCHLFLTVITIFSYYLKAINNNVIFQFLSDSFIQVQSIHYRALHFFINISVQRFGFQVVAESVMIGIVNASVMDVISPMIVKSIIRQDNFSNGIIDVLLSMRFKHPANHSHEAKRLKEFVNKFKEHGLALYLPNTSSYFLTQKWISSVSKEKSLQ